jgi:hypothetical protein
LTAARSRFQRFVDQRLFGARRDPCEVARRVGVSAAAAEAPGEALANLVTTVREVLALPYAAVELAGPTGGRAPCAESGSPVAWMEEVAKLPAATRAEAVALARDEGLGAEPCCF